MFNLSLTQQGVNLTLASDDQDVIVNVGQSTCQAQLTFRGLTCDLPDREPQSLDGDSLPRVVVSLCQFMAVGLSYVISQGW